MHAKKLKCNLLFLNVELDHSTDTIVPQYPIVHFRADREPDATTQQYCKQHEQYCKQHEQYCNIVMVAILTC